MEHLMNPARHDLWVSEVTKLSGCEAVSSGIAVHGQLSLDSALICKVLRITVALLSRSSVAGEGYSHELTRWA
jgi:hypothetical protein